MKRLYQYRLALKNGITRDGLILQIDQGFGDIAPLPGFSRETFLEAKEEAIRLLPYFPNASPQNPSVRFALDCALSPFPTALKLPVNALQELRPDFQALKLKVGNLSLDQALALLKKTPKHVELRLDFNRGWPLDKLLAFASHFSPTDFAYLEEPALEFGDLLAFSKMTQFPIAVDESIPSIPYWEIPTLKALIVKPTILGFIPSPPPNVELIFSSAYESGIGILHIAKLAQTKNPNRPHGLDPYSQLTDDLMTPRPTLQNGFISWSGGPIELQHPSLMLIASA